MDTSLLTMWQGNTSSSSLVSGFPRDFIAWQQRFAPHNHEVWKSSATQFSNSFFNYSSIFAFLMKYSFNLFWLWTIIWVKVSGKFQISESTNNTWISEVRQLCFTTKPWLAVFQFIPKVLFGALSKSVKTCTKHEKKFKIYRPYFVQNYCLDFPYLDQKMENMSKSTQTMETGGSIYFWP